MTLNQTTLVVAATAIGVMCLAACKPAEPELTARDLSGPANLSAADGTAFTDKCVARRAELFAYWLGRTTSIKPDEVQELKSDIDETFPRLCGCLVRELEKGLSKMQFMMAETMIEHGTYPDYPGSPIPEFGALKKSATQLGMLSTDFESARQKFRIHASHSAETCSLTLWAPSLARKMHIPELRSYSGPPAESKDDLNAPDAARRKAEKSAEDQSVRAYSLCLDGSARRSSRTSNDSPDAIEQASFASCAKNKQIVFDTYHDHANSFSPEMMTALEQEFRRKLPQIITKTRALRDAQPAAAPTKN